MRPSLNHFTLGSGKPRAEQFNLTESPTFCTLISLGGLDTMYGFTSQNKSKNQNLNLTLQGKSPRGRNAKISSAVVFVKIFMLDSKLTNIFYIDPCYCYDAPKLILSFAKVSTAIVLCCVFYRKLVTINEVSVDRKLLEWSCPFDFREGVTKYVTFENHVPVLVSDYWTLWFCDKLCRY